MIEKKEELTILDVLPVEVKKGTIIFNTYETLLSQAKKIAEYIRQVEVDEENIKEAKKLLAEVNKKIKLLEDNRKAVKNEMLAPYVTFEEQVKEIVNIVKEADTIVRDKVRELEELEREEKEKQIETIFNSKLKFYNFNDLVKFSDFLKPSMLNKTTSMNKIEEEISTFLEDVKSNFELIKTMDISEELLEEYLNGFNLTRAMSLVNSRKETKIKVIQAVKTGNKYLFIINDEKDAKIVELLLKQNEIKYIMEVK